jgi:hypothetical protein
VVQGKFLKSHVHETRDNCAAPKKGQSGKKENAEGNKYTETSAIKTRACAVGRKGRREQWWYIKELRSNAVKLAVYVQGRMAEANTGLIQEKNWTPSNTLQS